MLELSHKQLDVYQLSQKMIEEVYQLSKKFPKEELFGLTSQMRRASVSVCCNIAEGASRLSKMEKKRFYEIARSSIVEIDAQIDIATRLKYINNSDLQNLEKPIISIFKILSKMISNLANTNSKQQSTPLATSHSPLPLHQPKI